MTRREQSKQRTAARLRREANAQLKERQRKEREAEAQRRDEKEAERWERIRRLIAEATEVLRNPDRDTTQNVKALRTHLTELAEAIQAVQREQRSLGTLRDEMVAATTAFNQATKAHLRTATGGEQKEQAEKHLAALSAVRARHHDQLVEAQDGAAAAADRLELAIDVRNEAQLRASNSESVAQLLRWTVLRPGGWQRYVGLPRNNTSAVKRERCEPERLQLLESLGPSAWYAGSHLGNTVYLVAVFDQLAIADTADYGNALYYCPAADGLWKNTFRLEKGAALRAGARRIIHTPGWGDRVRRLVAR